MSMSFRPAPILWAILSMAARPPKEWNSRYPVAWLCIPRLFELDVDRKRQSVVFESQAANEMGVLELS